MKQIATILLASGVALITYGITRWITFKQFVTPDPFAEGDPRFITVLEHMLVAVIAGIITVSLSAYCFTRARQTSMAAAPVFTSVGRPSIRFRLGVFSALALVVSVLATSFLPVFAFGGFVAPVFISIVALVCGCCSAASLISERGFDRTVAALCAAVSLYALLRFGSYLLMIIP